MKLSEMYQGLMEKVAEDQVKLAEDDAYGRIMAHAFVDEIQKLSSKMDTIKGLASKSVSAVKDVASKASTSAKEVASKGKEKTVDMAGKVKQHYKDRFKDFASKSVKDKAKAVAPEAAAVLTPAAALAAYKMKKSDKK